MKPLTNGWRYAAVCSLLLALPLGVACGSDPVGTSEGNLEGAELEILFPKMYSAYDGKHEYKVPAKVDGVKNVKWSADPADAVDLEKQSDGSVMITVKKAVDVTIIAKAGPLRATAPLHVTEFKPEDWDNGKDRYANGVTFKRGDGSGKGGGNGSGGGGGGGDGGAGGKPERQPPDPHLACTNCHAKGGNGSDVEHTPMQTAGYTDDELVMIFTQGKKPAGVEMRIMTADKWQKIHKWEMEEDEKHGIISYLRALEPKSQGPTDWGGRGGGKGGGKGDGSGSGNNNNTGSDKPDASAGPT